MNSIFDPRSLPAQMILGFTVVVILTTAIAGLPAIWLIREQMDRQAWAQVEQGYRAVQALYAAYQGDIASKAILTSERPTLHELVIQDDRAALADYLRTLQAGAGFDLVLVCDPDHQVIASTFDPSGDNLCEAWRSGDFQVVPEETGIQVWLTAAQPIFAHDKIRGDVIVGMRLEDEFAAQMQAQTGLEHILIVNGQPVATSLEIGLSSLEQLPQQLVSPESAADIVQSIFELDNHPYYATRLSLDGPKLEAAIVLPVADIVATQKRLVLLLASSILVGAGLGSVLVFLISRRISQPLVKLAKTATEFSKGDLSSSVALKTRVLEVTQVAQALENARVDLERTLTNLERERAWVNNLLESIVEGIITLDSQGRITFFSKGAELITGWSRDHVLQRSCDEVFKLPDTEATFSQCIPAPGSRNKMVVELADGNQATLSVTEARLSPLEAGDAELALVFRDVSEEEAVHRLLGHFLANVAHEFRTPLSSLAAAIELLLDQASDLNPEELQELLISLHLSTLRLQTLVDNLLEGASIEAGHFHISPRRADLGKIVAEATEMMQPLLEKYSQHLIVELPTAIPVVYADERRTVQVLANLLSNASKFGPAEGNITVNAKVSQDWVIVGVTDQGPGIPPELRKDLFHRFTYSDSLSDSAKVGVGLGLSVVKAVVEAHGGQVGVDGQPGGGAIFWFTLPVMDE